MSMVQSQDLLARLLPLKIERLALGLAYYSHITRSTQFRMRGLGGVSLIFAPLAITSFLIHFVYWHFYSSLSHDLSSVKVNFTGESNAPGLEA